MRQSHEFGHPGISVVLLDGGLSLHRRGRSGIMRAVPRRYFRREWDDVRSGDHLRWGRARYFFETDENLVATRQVEVYASGHRLCYDATRPEDEHGFLADGPIFPDDEWPELFEITASEFEAEWRQGRAVDL